MAIALVLGGGAPNLTLMAGAVAALHEAGVKFDVVSTAGAGMLVGLLYAAPKGISPAVALKNTVKMGVHDLIYDLFPVNYKVFHKPGVQAQAYTRFWQTMTSHSGALEEHFRQWANSAMESVFPGPAWAPCRDMWQQLWSASSAAAKQNEDTRRLFNDWIALTVACLCPSDLGPRSLGMCQPAPFVDDVVDFDALKDFPGEFYLSAYCIEDRKMELFAKEHINLQHFQAALAFPLIYAPFKLNGKTYLEGATQDTLNFKGLFACRAAKKEDPIRTIVVCDVLGMDELIGEPRNLYDAWVKSIIIPLVAIAEDDLKLFEKLHMSTINTRYGQPEPALLRIDFKRHIPRDHWPNVLDWSYSNLNTLYEIGYAAGRAFYAEHAKRLTPAPVLPAAARTASTNEAPSP